MLRLESAISCPSGIAGTTLGNAALGIQADALAQALELARQDSVPAGPTQTWTIAYAHPGTDKILGQRMLDAADAQGALLRNTWMDWSVTPTMDRIVFDENGVHRGRLNRGASSWAFT